MQPFTTESGVAVALLYPDIDTDQIIPKQFLKRIERSGYGPFLFNDWRYTPDGAERDDFCLNQPPYRQAKFLIAGRNFGCGSSREHAVWALQNFGFRAVIAPSYADIFRSNSLKGGLLPIVLDESDVERLAKLVTGKAPVTITVDLTANTVDTGDWQVKFELDDFERRCLLEGLNDIGLTLEHEAEITSFEAKRPSWLPTVAETAS